MIASAFAMGAAGIAASFFPQEILSGIGLPAVFPTTVCLQITGALYLGFALMNWMAKTVLIGGIYARPLAMGNFMHFVVGFLALVKVAINHSTSVYIWIVTVLYFIFALAFYIVAFTSPAKKI